MTDGGVLQVIVREVFADRRPPLQCLVHLNPEESLTVGREAELALGVDAPDEGVSRRALTVTARPQAWELHLTNRNGAMVHAWAQAPMWLAFDSRRTLRWPRIGIRLVGNDQGVEHWVLLEADRYRLPVPALAEASATDTVLTRRPRGLTVNQLAAVTATFPAHLAWPPAVGPAARSLEAVAHRLGVTPSAVRERLRPVQERARDLGLQDQLGVTEPDYVYHLAAHGYLTDVPPPLTAP